MQTFLGGILRGLRWNLSHELSVDLLVLGKDVAERTQYAVEGSAVDGKASCGLNSRDSSSALVTLKQGELSEDCTSTQLV